MLDMNTGTLILGGAGADSIAVITGGDGSINGGSGADTISYSAIGGVATAAAGLGTINGGDGADIASVCTRVLLLLVIPSLAYCFLGNVTVGSGDSSSSAELVTAANWNDNNQVAVLVLLPQDRPQQHLEISLFVKPAMT